MNWKEVWQRKQRERAEGGISGGPDPEYWNKVAEDYSAWNEANDFECGRKAVEAIREIIEPEFEALEIGAGPGTLALPLAKAVWKMTAIEPSTGMIKMLLNNAAERAVENLDVINLSWQGIDDTTINRRFDIVACSHILWQFEDVDKQLERMEAASRGYCCVVHPAGGADMLVKDLWPEAVGGAYGGEVDPDLDDLVFAILRQRGILVNVKVIDFTRRLSVGQEMRLIGRLLGKHVEITPALRETIETGVLEGSRNGIYEAKSNVAVI